MFKTKTAELSWMQEGILLVKFNKSNEMIDLEEAKEQFTAAMKLTGGKKAKVLVDATESMQQMTHEAKEYLAGNEMKLTEAIVVKAIHQRLIASFFIKVVEKKQLHPVKVFNDMQKALDWLKETGN